jgi:aspartate aminotransferase-like enzyme
VTRANLRLPGPMPVSKDVVQAIRKSMIDHRGTACHDIMTRLPANLQKAFETRHEVSVLAASQPKGAAFRRASAAASVPYAT